MPFVGQSFSQVVLIWGVADCSVLFHSTVEPVTYETVGGFGRWHWLINNTVLNKISQALQKDGISNFVCKELVVQGCCLYVLNLKKKIQKIKIKTHCS